MAAQRAPALLHHMRRVRRLDERMQALQRQGRIGFYGACSGQEAAPVAAALLLEARDWVFPALRESSLLWVRGLSLESYLAQLFGNAKDLLKGRQMPSHHASRAHNHVSWSSAIGTQLPHAVGAALAARRLGSGAVVLGFMGDGATSHPDFHAAMNFAGVFRAPLVFVCQNNQYAISVPAARQTAASSFASKAGAYGLAADRVDGNDPLVVHDALARALDRARSGAGTTFIECVTYRIGPHSSSDDPSRYRSDAEVAEWRQRDPIARLTRYLQQAAPDSLAKLGDVELALDVELDALLPGLESVAAPARESLFDDVYARLPWHLQLQRQELLALRPPSDSRLKRAESVSGVFLDSRQAQLVTSQMFRYASPRHGCSVRCDCSRWWSRRLCLCDSSGAAGREDRRASKKRNMAACASTGAAFRPRR
ncbi:MAG: thiamine pyrophosphate-dependent enzyme [Polyangiaceae bacterium]